MSLLQLPSFKEITPMQENETEIIFVEKPKTKGVIK